MSPLNWLYAYVIFCSYKEITNSQNCLEVTCENGKFYCASQLRRMNYQNIPDGDHVYHCENGRAIYRVSCGSASCVEYLPQPYCACTPGLEYCGAKLQLMNWNILMMDDLYRCDKYNNAAYVKQCTGAYCKSFAGQNASCAVRSAHCAAGYAYCGYELVEMMYTGADVNTLYRCQADGSGNFVETCENGCIYGSSDSYCDTDDKVGRLTVSAVKRPTRMGSQRNLRLSTVLSDKDKAKAQKAMQNAKLYQGDVVLSGSQKMMLRTRVAIYDLAKRWPKGVIPYEIDTDIDSSVVDIIKRAAYDLYEKTDGCIRWVERTSEAKYVKFVKSTGCWSSLGMSGSGEQELSLADGCGNYGIIIHEMMHAMGFDHEQNRPDRDNFISVYFDNVADGKKHNFEKTPSGRTWTTYDYDSIMHYGEYAFSVNDEKTMEDKFKKYTLKEPYEKPGLTDSDATQIKKFYEDICTFNQKCLYFVNKRMTISTGADNARREKIT